MFLLEAIDFLALLGLWVQAFLAWVFVAVFAALRLQGESRAAYRSFQRAFLVLAVGLTVISWRFLRANDAATPDMWLDGMPLPVASYAVYMGSKAWFGLLLVRGSHRLAGAPEPRGLQRSWWPLVGAFTASPLLLPGMADLLALQAPMMIGCAWLAMRPLRPMRRDEIGPKLVYWSLAGLAVSWAIHALDNGLDRWATSHPLLSMNSFIDLGVQTTLGIGLVLSLLQDAHRRLRDAEREHERLRRSMQRDEKLRALGTVVSGVAHELNNPLTVVLAYASELRWADPTNEVAQILEEQAERCRGIVQNLSALAGQSVHPREVLDLERIAERVARAAAADRSAEGRRIVVGPMDGARCLGDRLGVEQVLTNLVLNGLQASPPDGTVEISARRDGDEVELCVADRGPGVPDELRERLFDPFFTTKDPGAGTGLGLSIVHAIVRGHGGSIEAGDRVDGPGAVFRVRLPAAREKETGTRAETDSGAPAAAPASERRTEAPAGRRLLLVDDDDAVRTVVRRLATRRGWNVSEAASGDEALEAAFEDYDAVLCDLRMPGLDGIDVHDRLAAERPELLGHVVFATGDLASERAARFSERCTRPLLTKPFDPEELFARLAEAAGSGPDVAPRAR